MHLRAQLIRLGENNELEREEKTMGLFFNYSKEGPGVPRDLPPKRGFFRFFEILGRKYSKLIGLNLLYFICSLPVAAVYFFMSTIVVANLFDAGIENYSYNVLVFSVYITLFLLMVLGGGPFTAGFCYVIRNFSREEHAFVVSDFFEHTKKNLKQSLIVTLIDFVFIFLIFVNINFYTSINSANLKVAYFTRPVLLVFTVSYFMSRMYLYSLMVTFEANLKKIFKVSYLLTMLKLPQNVMMFAINIALFVLSAMAPSLIFIFIITPLLLLSITYLSQSMYTTAVIKNNIHFDNEKQKDTDKQIFMD